MMTATVRRKMRRDGLAEDGIMRPSSCLEGLLPC